MEINRETYLSPEWNDFILGKFEPNEMIDGHPVVSGLRRIAELYLGDIIFSGVTEVFPVGDHGGRATAVYKVVIKWIMDGSERTFVDVADVSEENTDNQFLPFAMATAATRAEARCYRKMLKLRVCANEELTKEEKLNQAGKKFGFQSVEAEDDDNDLLMSPQQLVLLNSKGKQTNVNIEKLMMKELGTIDLNSLTKKQAAKLIGVLNAISNLSTVDEDLQGYNSNWSKT